MLEGFYPPCEPAGNQCVSGVSLSQKQLWDYFSLLFTKQTLSYFLDVFSNNIGALKFS